MGNLDFSANADQLQELLSYIASQINVPTIGIGGGYAPIGSINFFDATTAPQDWLACDGTVYNIADYPQLADYYESQHGSKNFYGGDGTTTFAVPDLQGEFLRGTGTNSHANQGSGANVGEHQDGTAIPQLSYYSASKTNSNVAVPTSGSAHSIFPLNSDSAIGTSNGTAWINTANNNSAASAYNYTSRPTNTSFLICIKAVVAGEVYSTEERVVGTWIDGKKLYKKTFLYNNSITLSSTFQSVNIADISDIGIDTIIKIEGSMSWGVLPYTLPFVMNTDDTKISFDSVISDNKLVVRGWRNSGSTTITNVRVTLRYTKTTD